MSLLAGAMEEQEEEFVQPIKVRMLQPEVDKEAGNQLSMVVNSGEVGRYSIAFVHFSTNIIIRNGEVISQLRHTHKMTVLATRCEEATFLVGSQLAVIRSAKMVVRCIQVRQS